MAPAYNIHRLALGIVLCAFVNSAAVGDPDPIREAYYADDHKDYKREVDILKPLAVQGNPQAQVLLGYLYHHGRGVNQDSAEAVAWWTRAAEQGYDSAYVALGDEYSSPYGYQIDLIKAYVYMSLSISKDAKPFHYLMDEQGDLSRVKSLLSPEQLAEAQRALADYRATHPNAPILPPPPPMLEGSFGPPLRKRK